MQTRMNPDLVCKINVGGWRGSGYPITPDRILTAAHVVAEALESQGQITLAFGHQNTPIDSLVSVLWADRDIDVAVLGCQLPPALQPAHELLLEPPATPMAWHAQGYTDFGKANLSGGQDGYHGTLLPFAVTKATVPLGCTDGPVTADQWAGGSGSVAFDSATSQTALAVITDYQGGKKLDHLLAVPLCYLLHAEATCEGFRQAIQFEAYTRCRDYRDKVIQAITTKLQKLEKQTLEQVRDAINPLLPQAVQIDKRFHGPDCAEPLASAMVLHVAVTEVLACLGRFRAQAPGRSIEAEALAAIIDYVLPLNYTPGLTQRLWTHLATDPCGLVEGEAPTHSLAELIMAAYDRQRAQFVEDITRQKDRDAQDIRGATALPYPEGPEDGPDVSRTAHSLILDLLQLKDTFYSSKRPDLRRPQALPSGNEAEAVEQLKADAEHLGGALKAVSDLYERRTVYCVLKHETTPHAQAFRKQVLSTVRQYVQPYVPKLIFVELVKRPLKAHEATVDMHINFRVLRP